MISNVFAKRVIRYLLDCKNEKLPKEMMFAFELNIIMLTLRVKKGIIYLEKDTILGKEMCVDDFVRNVIPTVWDK